MALTWVWVGMVCVALIYGAATGQSAAVGAAAAQGVQQAVTFCLTVGGMICLWSGVMEVMRRSGIAAGLSRLLQPVLRRLFPRASRDAQTLDALSMNVSANLLGLGNAATPAGVRAAQAMARELRGSKASDELCLLVVLNTASIQLLPVTIAAVREAAGAAVPFDILPAVWVTSLCSVTVRTADREVPGARMAVSDVLALTVPALLAGVGLYGALTGTDVFSALTAGALDGLRTVVRIFPALVALLAAVSMLRASGALDALTRLCAPVLAWLGIPPETAILMVVRPVSGSGALAAASDIIGAYGPDSRIGRTAAVMLGSTETTFYVLAVYFGACGVRRSRWAIPAAIAADLTGFLVAAALVRWIWGA
ncbi:MAG: nucleoside recognition domain-containing protein [Oscillospiraceae bacterium]